MSRRLRRSSAVPLVTVLLLVVLAACGSGSGAPTSSTAKGLGAVSIKGGVGTKIGVVWHHKVAKPRTTTVTTLVKGSGARIASGDSVTTYLWIGNGTTKKVAYSDYTNGSPESIPNTGRLNDVFTKLLANATYGSRIAVVTTAKSLLGTSTGSSQLGIGGNDNLVVVADLVEKTATSPAPADARAHTVPSSKLPAVVVSKGKPTGLRWAGIAKPATSTPVQRALLKKGTGALVKATDTVTVNYLGETYRATKPFDESYSKQAFTQPLSSLVPGWKIGLTGVRVGSRVLLQIPPAYGYGAQGSGAIPGNATLWFVIDVVKAKAA